LVVTWLAVLANKDPAVVSHVGAWKLAVDLRPSATPPPSCHDVYAMDGVSESKDQMQEREEKEAEGRY
jgi:hypothetical protein